MTQSRILADTPAKVARGNNHGKNLIINGDFSVWQRGTSGFGTSVYSADRWYNQFGVTSADRTTSNIPTTSKYGMQLNRSTTGQLEVEQRIEAAAAISTVGKVLTFSFYNDVSVGTLDDINIYLITADAEDDWSAATVRETVNIPSPVEAGINTVTFSANHADAANGFEIRISYNVTGNTTTTLSNVQLEFGDTATDFEYVKPSEQLANCQRYFERFDGSDYAFYSPAMGYVESTTSVRAQLPWTEKRGIPTLTFSAGSTFLAAIGGSDLTASAIVTAGTMTKKGGRVQLTVAGATTGQGALVSFNDSAGYINIDAEL